jgi:hypothetical protein
MAKTRRGGAQLSHSDEPDSTLTIDADAPPGIQGIQVTTGTETVNLAGAFTVNQGPPLSFITSVTVANGGGQIA